MEILPFDTRFMDNGDRLSLLWAKSIQVLGYDATEFGSAQGVLTRDKIVSVREIAHEQATLKNPPSLEDNDKAPVVAYKKLSALAEAHRDLLGDSHSLETHVMQLLDKAEGTFQRVQSHYGVVDANAYFAKSVANVGAGVAERKERIDAMLASVSEIDISGPKEMKPDGKISMNEVEYQLAISKDFAFSKGANDYQALMNRVKGLIEDYGENNEISVSKATKIIESQELGMLVPPAKKIIPIIDEKDQGVGI